MQCRFSRISLCCGCTVPMCLSVHEFSMSVHQFYLCTLFFLCICIYKIYRTLNDFVVINVYSTCLCLCILCVYVYIIKNSLRFIHIFFCVMLAYLPSEIMPKLLDAYFCSSSRLFHLFCAQYTNARAPTHCLVNLPGFSWKNLKKKESIESQYVWKIPDTLCAIFRNY